MLPCMLNHLLLWICLLLYVLACPQLDGKQIHLAPVDSSPFYSDAPDVSKRTRWVEPLASFDKDGVFEWDTDLFTRLENLSKPPQPPGPRR